MEEAYNLHKNTTILALIDCPQTLKIGMDNIELKIGSKFKGIKHIPTGSHYIYYSMKEENYMYKIGFFIYAVPGDVLVKKWDPEVEDFVDISSKEEGERYIAAGRNMELEPYLANYPLEKTAVWKELSGFIDKEVVSKIEPVSKKIYTTSAEYKDEKNPKKEDFDNIRGTLFFTELPKKFVEYDVVPKERTDKNFDKTAIFDQVLKKQFKGDIKAFFGEMQFAFVVFILGENVEGFEQWKKMVIMLSFADKLVYNSPAIVSDFIPILYSQLQQFPTDFFQDSITSNNFMSSCLKNLLELAYDTKAQLKIRKRVAKLEAMLKEKFDFKNVADELDLGEDGPTLCEQLEMVSLHEENEGTQIYTVIDTSKTYKEKMKEKELEMNAENDNFM